jgi:hypothetical protein
LRNSSVRARLYYASASTLLVGAISSLLLYRSAEKAEDSALVQEFLNSKRYLHDVKTYGGNVAVMADEFSRWFDSLWQGEMCAITVAVIALVLSVLLFIIGYFCPPGQPAELQNENE